jgi:hypothetical protein
MTLYSYISLSPLLYTIPIRLHYGPVLHCTPIYFTPTPTVHCTPLRYTTALCYTVHPYMLLPPLQYTVHPYFTVYPLRYTTALYYTVHPYILLPLLPCKNCLFSISICTILCYEVCGWISWDMVTLNGEIVEMAGRSVVFCFAESK